MNREPLIVRLIALALLLAACAGPTPAPTVVPAVATITNRSETTNISAGPIAPYPGAPLCSSHDTSVFHTLWDGVRGCHYDHEHGVSPFTPNVAAAFPGFDLQALLGNTQIGSTNNSSPIENTVKHGGFKWQVQLANPHPCAGYQGSTNGLGASVVEIHAFGTYSVELQSRTHSAVALLQECSAANPSDIGYVFAVNLLDYGQRVVPYQGEIAAYPNEPSPAYDHTKAPYFTSDCVNGGVVQCRASLAYVLAHHLAANSLWTSQNAERLVNSGTHLFQVLFRLRDTYQLFDWNNQVYPFTFLYICSSDGGVTYNPAGCAYTDSTMRVQEIYGTIPASWDNLAGFDTDPRVGRITGQGYTDKLGNLDMSCGPGLPTCYPIKLVGAFVGSYGSLLTVDKLPATTRADQVSRNIYFCGGVVCGENDAGAVPSGWIGQNN